MKHDEACAQTLKLASALDAFAAEMNGDIITILTSLMTDSAKRLRVLHRLLEQCLPHVQASAQSEHILDGLGPRHELPIDRMARGQFE